jgi:hypothetical protein
MVLFSMVFSLLTSNEDVSFETAVFQLYSRKEIISSQISGEPAGWIAAMIASLCDARYGMN